MDQHVTRGVIVAFVGLSIGTTILFFNDQVAEADGFFGCPITWWAR
jgi:hypothetical protein